MNSSKTQTLSLLVAISGAVACGAFVGCSSTDTTVNENPDGSTVITPGSDGSTITPGNDGSTGDDTTADGGGDDTVDAGPATVGAGSVSLSQTSTGSGYTYTASAGFAYSTGTTTVTSACAPPVAIAGSSCVFYTSCAPAAVVDAGTVDSGADADAAVVDAAAPVYPQAGVISITGLSKNSSGLSLDVNSAGTGYTPLTGTTQQFANGDMLTIAGVGDANSIGAFSIASIAAPADVNLTAPVFTGTAVHTTTIDRSADKVVTWTGGATGSKIGVTVETINIANASAAGGVKYVSCTFDSGSGTGTIPSANGLALLDHADGTTVLGSFNLSSSTAASSTATNNDTSVAGAGVLTVSASVSATPYTGTYTGN